MEQEVIFLYSQTLTTDSSSWSGDVFVRAAKESLLFTAFLDGLQQLLAAAILKEEISRCSRFTRSGSREDIISQVQTKGDYR